MAETLLLATFIFVSSVYCIWIAMLIRKRIEYAPYAPPVTIILPAHNEEAHIESALRSILSDGYPRKEIIVVDDGSTDGTYEIAKKFGKARLLRTDHKGKSAALNKGLQNARHSIIITLDADSEIAKGSIAEIVKPLKDRKTGGAAGVIRAKTTLNPLTWFQDFEYIMSSGWRYACTNINGNSILPGFAAFRKEALEKIGGFSRETLTEDFDIAVSLRQHGYSTVTVKDACIFTNVPQSLASLARQRLRWGRGTLQVMRKHFRFVASRKSGPLGYLTIPSQFYWYIHAFLYLPLILYMMFFVWSRAVTYAYGYLSIEFVRYIFTVFSVYGIIDLLAKTVTHQYGLTAMIFFSLLMFFLSFVYSVLVFSRVSRPGVRVLIAYIFFFPYSLLNLLMLMVSALQEAAGGRAANKWHD